LHGRFINFQKLKNRAALCRIAQAYKPIRSVSDVKLFMCPIHALKTIPWTTSLFIVFNAFVRHMKSWTSETCLRPIIFFVRKWIVSLLSNCLHIFKCLKILLWYAYSNFSSPSCMHVINTGCIKKKVIELQRAIASELLCVYDQDFFIFGKIRLLSDFINFHRWL
jgi:hypothetical protein